MRQILLPILLVAQLFISCEKEKDFNNDCKIRYNYDGSEKYTEIPYSGIISFYDTLSSETINQIIEQYQEIEIISIRNRHVIISIDSKNCATTDKLFASIKNDPRISNCNKTLLTVEGYTYIITDVFGCKLKSITTQIQLMELVAENKVELINPDMSGDFFLIRADKNSVGDALNMAHIFFESGYFEWTEPDYFSSSFKN